MLTTTSAEVKNAWSYTARRTYAYIAWYLVQQSDNFIMLCILKWGWQVPTKLHGVHTLVDRKLR